jgi:hypothetical protein
VSLVSPAAFWCVCCHAAVKIGRPGYRVTKQFDQETRQRSLLFQVGECWKAKLPRYQGITSSTGSAGSTSSLTRRGGSAPSSSWCAGVCQQIMPLVGSAADGAKHTQDMQSQSVWLCLQWVILPLKIVAPGALRSSSSTLICCMCAFPRCAHPHAVHVLTRPLTVFILLHSHDVHVFSHLSVI